MATRSDIQTIIDRLVEERQTLRAANVEGPALDANRKALAYWQLALTRVMADEALASNQNGKSAAVGAT